MKKRTCIPFYSATVQNLEAMASNFMRQGQHEMAGNVFTAAVDTYQRAKKRGPRLRPPAPFIRNEKGFRYAKGQRIAH